MGQIIPKEQASYNDRLFKKGIRKKVHEARFFWLRKTLTKLGVSDGKILELGCFDGKSIEYLLFSPSEYVGYDANWENGLEAGVKKWSSHENYRFVFCDDVKKFDPQGKFDVTIALETIEHLPLNDLEDYLKKIQEVTTGYFLISVPVEKGVPFLLKHLFKKAFLEVDEPYSAKEFLHATLGNLKSVKRVEFGHKGFDYSELLRLLNKYFIIKEVDGLPFSFLPKQLNITVGVVAIPRKMVK